MCVNDKQSNVDDPGCGTFSAPCSVSDPAFIIDPTGTILEANSAFSSLFAIPTLSIEGLNAYGLQASAKHIPAVAARLREMVEEVIVTGKYVSFEEVLQGRTYKHVIDPERSGEGEIVRLLVTVREADREKNPESKETETFRSFLEALPGVAFLTDDALKLIGWNHHACDLFFGRHEATMTGIDAFSPIHPDDQDHVREVFRNVLELGADEFVETRVHHHGRSIHVWWKIHGKRVLIDGNACLMIIGTDISELKQREIELREHKKRFSQTLSASRVGVWEWNLKTNEKFWSDEMWNLYGLEQGNQKPSYELWASALHPEDRDMVILATDEAAQKKHELNLEYRICCSDGSIRWLMVRGRPVNDSQGHAISYIGTVIDITDRKQLFERVLSSEAKYRSIFDTIPKGITYCRMIYEDEIPVDFIYLIVNPAFESLTGHRNVVGKRFTEVLPNTHLALEEFFQLVSRVAGTGLPEQTEYYLNTFNEWLSITVVSPEKDHFVATFEVITELKRAELSAREDKAKLDGALASMTDALFFCDTDGRLIDFNEAFATFYRFRSKKECLKSLAEYPDILEAHLENDELAQFDQWAVPRALRGETASQAIYRLRRKDTGETWTGSYGFAPVRDNNGQIVGAVVTARDITDQKYTENALRENEIKFRSIFDYAPVAIGIGDISEGQMMEVNTSWLNLFGYTRDEVIGRKVSDLRLYSDCEERDRIVGILKAHGRVEKRHVLLRKKSGEIMNILYSAESMTLGGRPCLLVMMIDVTPPNREEKEIESFRKNALHLEPMVAESTILHHEECDRIRDFMTMMAYECLTPLSIIRGNIDLIELKMKFGDCMNDIELNKINRSVDRMMDLLDVAIQESRISETHKTESLTVFRIAPLIAALLESFRAIWPERSIIYSGHLDECEVSGKPLQIKLAIFNLLDRARKNSPPDSLIDMQVYPEGGAVVFRIRNQGSHILPDEEKIISTHKKEHRFGNISSDGMQLWLVLDIVERHGGSVALENIETGVEVTVRLPLSSSSG
jgi:PAS domain S-box-containing protein